MQHHWNFTFSKHVIFKWKVKIMNNDQSIIQSCTTVSVYKLKCRGQIGSEVICVKEIQFWQYWSLTIFSVKLYLLHKEVFKCEHHKIAVMSLGYVQLTLNLKIVIRVLSQHNVLIIINSEKLETLPCHIFFSFLPC